MLRTRKRDGTIDDHDIRDSTMFCHRAPGELEPGAYDDVGVRKCLGKGIELRRD
jgi:hypothetical protein